MRDNDHGLAPDYLPCHIRSDSGDKINVRGEVVGGGHSVDKRNRSCERREGRNNDVDTQYSKMMVYCNSLKTVLSCVCNLFN